MIWLAVLTLGIHELCARANRWRPVQAHGRRESAADHLYMFVLVNENCPVRDLFMSDPASFPSLVA